MEQLYQDYKDIAEFRLLYINEAHASDGRRPVPYAKEKGISEHDDYAERCVAAEMLMDDKTLTIPFVIDHMDNKVNEAYKASPDRIFLVRTDGRLAIAGKRGPFGFAPALKEVEKWLVDFKKTESEPALPDDAAEAGDEVDAQAPTKEEKEGDSATSQPGDKKDDDGGKNDDPGC